MITDRHDFRLRYMNDPVLKESTAAVEQYHPGIKDICLRMIDVMYGMRAYGLAANQVGIPLRIFVMDTEFSFDKKQRPINKNPITLINPEIIEQGGSQNGEEGCLSIPNQRLRIERSKSITVRYMDIDGLVQIKTFTDLAARCVQHEIDHLEGKLMIDHVPQNQKMLVAARHVQEMRKIGRNR